MTVELARQKAWGHLGYVTDTLQLKHGHQKLKQFAAAPSYTCVVWSLR